MTWKQSLVYYLTTIAGERHAPLVERLSRLVGLPAFADGEYQAAIRDMASEA